MLGVLPCDHMATTTISEDVEQYVLNLLDGALPGEAMVSLFWRPPSMRLWVEVSLCGRRMAWRVGDELFYDVLYASDVEHVWRLARTAQAFCERALGAAERGPYW